MYDQNYTEFGQQRGWVCPKCGRVYSPTTPMCYYCGGGKEKLINSPTTIPNDGGFWQDYLTRSIIVGDPNISAIYTYNGTPIGVDEYVERKFDLDK